MPNNVEHTVIEKAGDSLTVTIHLSTEDADQYAIKLAMENEAGTEAEIAEHLLQFGYHAEGDYAVYVADAIRK